MTTTANIKATAQPSAAQASTGKAELSNNYGPIGLKAVVAAALMVKKPAVKKPA